MFKEYSESFYASFNGEENHYYHTSLASDAAQRTEDGSFVIPRNSAVVKIVRDREIPGGCSAVVQHTELVNNGDAPLNAEALSSIVVTGIGKGGSKPWNRGRFVLHYAYSCWTGEAQWRHVSAENAGLYRTYNHGSQSTFHLASKSTWSTCQFEPVLMIEDTELNRTFYVQMRCGHGWTIEAGIRGYRDDIELCILGSDCFIRNDGWNKTVAPGEKIKTCKAVAGAVYGGFEEAVRDLTKANRACMKNAFPGGRTPLCYNDYMNALWALPTKEKSLALIEAAAKAGADYYVMDAGWYSVKGSEILDLGAWEINDSLFGDEGLQGIFDAVRAHGMLPGIWLEIESAGSGMPLLKEHPEYALTRRGNVLGKDRVLLDFRIPEVRAYIEKVFDKLYAMGVRFIKNDYNANTGPEIDPNGAESVREHSEAFEQFIDRICEKYPDLIIENCGSGAMRSDEGTLSHFHLQSVSDQEDYFRLPSIVSGSEVCYPPERCGVWTYPYPVKIDYRESFMPSPEFTTRFTDGKNTVYNMVSGLAGLMYLSGRIDCADQFNEMLIRGGTELYKKYRDNVSASFPVFPTGTFDIDSDGVNTFGLLNDSAGLLMLYIWNNDASVKNLELDLDKYAPDGFEKICDVYPHLLGYRLSIADNDKSTVSAMLPSGPSALFAVLKLK